MVTQVVFQFQISAPIYRNPAFIITANMANALLPFLRLTARGSLKPNALDLIKSSFVTLPFAIFIVKIVTLALAFIIAFLGLVYNYRTQVKKVKHLRGIRAANGHI